MFPKWVRLDGLDYAVSVLRDGDGEINYFQLLDTDGRFFREFDWNGCLTVEDIRGLLLENAKCDGESSASEVEPVQETRQFSGGGRVPAVVTGEEIDWLDDLYPHYANFPLEFKSEAVRIHKSFSSESSWFRDICVSELAEVYEEEMGHLLH